MDQYLCCYNNFTKIMQFYSAQGADRGLRLDLQQHYEVDQLNYDIKDRRANFDANKSGHWSQKENCKYYAFVKKFQDKFSEKESRRQWKVFKAMAIFVKTRNANQCRSHHHKMTKNHANVQEALDFMRNRNPKLEDRVEKYLEQLEKIDFSTIEEGQFSQVLSKINTKNPQKHQNKPILNFSVQNPVDAEQFKKETDMANMRTAATYGQQPQEYQAPPNLTTSPYSPYSSYESLKSPSLPTNFAYYYPGFDFNQPQSYQVPYAQSREQLWRECHSLFLAWMDKLNALTQM